MKRFVVLAMVSVLVLLLGRTTVGQPHAAAPASPPSGAGHSPPGKTKLLVRGDYNYPPYQFLQQGEPSGFDCDLIRAVAEVMDFDMTIELGPWPQVRDALKDRRIDAIVGMGYSEQRAQTMDFSVPTALVFPGLFVRADSPIRSFEELRGRDLVIEAGDVLHETLQREGLTSRLSDVDDPAEALRLVAAGKRDAAILSSKVQGYYFIDKLGLTNLREVQTRLSAIPYCIAVAKGNTELVHRLNEGLNILKATGNYRAIHEKWFGVYEPKPRVKPAQLALAAAAVAALLAASLLWSWSLRRQVRRRTAELRTSEEKYRLLVNTTAEGVIVMAGQRLVFVNPAVVAITGYSAEQLLALPFLKLVHPADLDAVQEQLCQTPGDGRLTHCQFRLVPRSGEPRWILCHSVGIVWAGNACCLRILTDITARKRAEEELQQAHERLQDIIEFLPDATFVIDKDKRVIAWNRAMEGMTGVGKAEMLGQGDYAYSVPFWGQRRPTMIDLIGGPSSEVEASYESFERRNDAIYVETFVPSLYGGAGAYVWAIASPLLDKQGNRDGAIESVRDITKHKRAEEELIRYRHHLEELVADRTAELAAANKALAERTSQLQVLTVQLTEAEQRERRRIAYVLHEDLQQLLVAAKLGVCLLRDKGYRSAAEQTLESLDRAIAVSRSLTHELRPPVLYELGLGAALEWLGRRAREQYNLAVDVAVDPGAEPASDNLRILLFEAVHGLLLNVVKHAHVNAAEVRLSRSDDQVQILVADQGVGFDPSQASGRGFGLFSLRERLELLGGRLDVDSIPGHGTRVRLTMPIQTLPATCEIPADATTRPA